MKEEEAPQRMTLFDRFMQWLLRAPIGAPAPRRDNQAGIIDVLRIYFSALRRYPVTAFFVVVAAFVGGIGSLVLPYIFKIFLDALDAKDAASIAPIDIIWIILIVGIIRWAAWRGNYVLMAALASRVMADLKQRAFGHLIDHSERFFSSTFTGSLVQRVNRLAGSYDRIADRFVYDIIPVLVQVVGAIFILTNEEPRIGYIVMAWLGVFIVWNYVFARWKLKYDIGKSEADSRSTGFLADVITNHQTVELNATHDREREGYRVVTDRQALLQRFSWQTSSVLDGIQALFVVLVEFAVFYVGIQLWNEGRFTIGLFVLAQVYIGMLSEKLWTFSRMIRDIHEAFADAKEMVEIMLLPHEITEISDPTDPDNIGGTIEFRGVSFSFDKKEVLHGVSFTINKGERVALVGPSGAGKSTIVKLLLRQYDATSGNILIDGVDLRNIRLTTLRNALCLVPQEPILFHRTLMDNIRYGKWDADESAVVEAARVAHCEEFILNSPKGYETFVGERGIKLSGGERQRVAIARAFLKGSPIIIFDEATSSLDSESEKLIQDALDKLMRDCTTLVIAHRLSTIRRMDRIIVLSDGGIVESGTHDELLRVGGLYKKLWDLQQGGFISTLAPSSS